ncbi:hypothetical protein G6F56_002616 [Rhizopus delemar]|nr:hypothetical protein G6F56_002616 [Rhizopus delemar]
MDKETSSSLTSFNFETTENEINEEGVLSKIIDKVKSAVSGHSTSWHDNTSIHSGCSEKTTHSNDPSVSSHAVSMTSSFLGSNKKDAESTVSRSSTIATTNATVVVGKHEETVEPVHTVQFIMPSTSSNSLNRRSLEESSMDLLPLYTRKSIDSDTQSVITNFSISNTNSLSRILARLRGQKNDKEFWMPDEQCKECYKCRKPFTLLRRKHHCRTCGQIFCSKCASHIVSGKLFKQKGQVRVCNFCFSEQQQQQPQHHEDCTMEPIIHFKSTHSPLSKQVTNETIHSEPKQEDKTEDYGSQIIPSQKPPLAVPNMQIPTTAFKQTKSIYGNDDATTFALEIPMYGSESYNSPQAERPHSPFYPEQPTSPILHHNTPFVHSSTPDNVYTGVKRLLDAGSSLIKSRPRSNTSTSAPLLEDVRPSHQPPFRASYLDRGGGTVLTESELSPFPGNEPDFPHEEEVLYDRPLTPIKTTDPPNGGISDDESYDYRLIAKRTEELRGKNVPITSKSSYHSYRRLSFTGHTPKMKRAGLSRLTTTFGVSKHDHPASPGGSEWSPIVSPYEDNNRFFSDNGRLRLNRQRRTSGPPPTVELSLSARQHARRLLRQLMQGIELNNKEEWEDVIMNILMKVTNNVQPDTRSGDDMDVRHYIKIKKIPGGLPSDSFYAKGVVCTKNVAHKRMVKNISNPRILILLFSLDYSRVEMENQLLSITPVISQEREHISKLVGRIVALKPSLLLVKSTVSRLALEFLLAANIPVIHNVKESVINAVARCTQASVITSVDKLSVDKFQQELSFGRCGSFEIKTFLHEWIPHRRKTYLIFDDCSPELGGTIVLRGERLEKLDNIKHLVDFMIFAVNNLKYETSLLRDSFAKNRGSLDFDERDRSPLILQSPLGVENSVEEEEANEINDSLKLYQDTVLSVSQFVKFSPPYLLMKLKEMEDKLLGIYQLKRRKSSYFSTLKDTQSILSGPTIVANSASSIRSTFEKQTPQVRSVLEKHSLSRPSSTHDTQEEEDYVEYEQELAAQNSEIARVWETYDGETSEVINPHYHQNIVVLYSSVCTLTTVPCRGPEIRVFGYYKFDSDKTLGQYVMNLCADANQPCTSLMCDHSVLQHYQSYAHGNARVNVTIERFPCPLPSMSHKLMMWSYCRQCNKHTPVLPMSENTWNYSFGKFLEIFLYQEGVHCRADICPHDMSRNHVRYFGYMDMTVRFEYDSIDLLEVAVPPMKLYIKGKVQREIKEGELNSLRSKINRFYQSIMDRNKSFPFDLVDPHRLEACKAELQELSLEAQGEKKDALQTLQNVYATSDPEDTLAINMARRNLFQIVEHWDAVYTEFARFYLEPERELKKITTNHLRKMFPTDLSDMDTDERTKRAAEVTDLPLLGIGLDDDGDDGYSQIKSGQNKITMMPALISPLTALEKTNLSTPSESKSSFLRPELRRRLSLELMRELNEKFKEDEPSGGNTTASDFDQPNKYSRRTPGSISAAFTPSRIPLYSGKNSSSTSLYSRYKRGDDKQGQKQQPMGAEFPTITSLRRAPLHHRHHSIGHSQHIQEKSKSLSEDEAPSFLRRSVTSRDKRFRSRLPRKKTYIQVYTQAKDLVKEDIDDEFYPDHDAFSMTSRKPKRASRRTYHAPLDHLSGTDADHDDDSVEELEKSDMDYFSPAAPYSCQMIEAEKESEEAIASTVKPYITFSDGQMSSVSGDDVTDRDLPCASDLLMAQQSVNDHLTIEELHNIHPDLTHSPVNTPLRYIAADESRHSPEKMSFMKTLTNFLTDSGLGNLLPLELPLKTTEHLFPDSFVVVREDEPSTIIAYTLSSEDYLDKMHDIQNHHHDTQDTMDNKRAPSEITTFEGFPPYEIQ